MIVGISFWKRVQICETILIKMTKSDKSVEIQQKVTEQELKFDNYLENVANQSALIRFRFWIENQNFENILVKMLCELLKSAKK